MEFSEIVAPLLSWYDKNKRELMWRENRDPYRIWISEIMLQQTRVEAVKEYYARFLEKLPDLQSLASAQENTLLKLWEGLGYYSRVRNLKKAAQIICEKYNGIFPSHYEEIRSLPGIGDYTAGAISSIAFDLKVPAVDGNVLRVFSRLTESSENILSADVKKSLSKKLERIYPEGRCGDFTQSLMELGALICLPGGIPKCMECPLSQFCKANLGGTQMNFPVKEKKKKRLIRDFTVLWIEAQGKIALRKRPARGLLASLWELPNTEGVLLKQEVEALAREWGLQVVQVSSSGEKTHIFTHVEWNMHCFKLNCMECAEGFIWVTPDEMKEEYSIPTAFKKCLEL